METETKMSIKPYKKAADYSYTLGAFPTIELIKSGTAAVRGVYIHSSFPDAKQLSGLCRARGIPLAVVPCGRFPSWLISRSGNFDVLCRPADSRFGDQCVPPSRIRDGVAALARYLFEEATDITIYFGRAVNEAHQGLDIEFAENTVDAVVPPHTICRPSFAKNRRRILLSSSRFSGGPTIMFAALRPRTASTMAEVSSSFSSRQIKAGKNVKISVC